MNPLIFHIAKMTNRVPRRRRVSGEDDDSEDDENRGTPQPAVKTRVLPKRAAYVHPFSRMRTGTIDMNGANRTGKIPTQPIVITDSEDEGHIPTPKAKKTQA